MGSFNATCIISNLQIEAGTPVRFFLLTAARFGRPNEHPCYVWGRWQLRGPAVRAKYNDYGSVENIKGSLAERVMFEALNRDAVEMGVGDNQCHDVQVRRGMSQKDWLEALWEGRVFVHDHDFKLHDWTPTEPAEGIPSIKRIERLLTVHNLPVTTAYGAEGYVIDQETPGFIRVRYGGFASDAAKLETALALITQEYSAMVMCGTGYYPNEAEILVAPKPAPSRGLFLGLKAEDELSRDTPRAVSQVMVREDVWKILLRTRFRSWSDEVFDFKRMKSDAMKWLERTRAKEKVDPRLAALDLDDFARDNLFSQAIHGGEGVSGFSPREAFRLGIKLAKDEEELETYMTDLAEMLYVQMVYGGLLHGQWHPTTNSGQDPNWDEHRAFLKKLSAIRGIYEDD
jgi:hypothetical protein